MAQVYVKKINKNDYQSQAEYRDAYADNVEAAIKLFRKKVTNEGIMKEIQDRMYYVSPGEKRRKAARKKLQRNQHLLLRLQKQMLNLSFQNLSHTISLKERSMKPQ